MKQTIKFYFEVVVEANNDTLLSTTYKIEPNILSQGQKLNAVFCFQPDYKIFGGNINAKDYSNKIISYEVTKSEVAIYDETTNSTRIKIFDSKTNVKDEDKDNEADD